MSRRILVVTASVLALLTGCTSAPEEPEHQPSGADLVDDASTALRDLRSVHFDLRTQGALDGFPVRSVEGSATRDGWAAGDVDLQRPTTRTQYSFEIGERDQNSSDSGNGGSNSNGSGNGAGRDGDTTVTLTDADDTATTVSLPRRFTPSTLLARDGGLRSLLDDATDLHTESREDIDDVPAYRVSARLPEAQISRLLPGIPDDVAAKFWVSDDPERTLLRVWLQVPPSTPNEGAVILELGLSEHNRPVETSSAATTPSG